MAEVLFYHLERGSALDVLPPLLEKCLERGWRAVVQTADVNSIEALDLALWTYRDTSFLPHGKAGGDFEAEQPILIAADASNGNGAQVRFLLDGAAPENVADYTRVILIFDGRNHDALQAAREHWKVLKTGDHELTYWQQGERGGWEKKA